MTQRLQNVLLEDSNNGQGGYIVVSLYFDTYSNSDYYAKLSGFEIRKKYLQHSYY